MTEILVHSIEDEQAVVRPVPRQTNASSIQMLGFAADQSTLSMSTRSDRFQASGRERVNSRTSQYNSVRSEPDLDTIMPLLPPGSSSNRRGPYDSDSESGGDPAQSPASFTTVEVTACKMLVQVQAS